MMRLASLRLATVLVAVGLGGGPWPGSDAQAATSPRCGRDARPMAFGYFDHTAAWYRREPELRTARTVASSWRAPDQDAVVVLYSDISAAKPKATAAADWVADVRERIEGRSGDIVNYLKAAAANGHVKVYLQAPELLGKSWADQPESKALLREFVRRWGREPAVAGFYLFDEPELSGIPARTLQEMTEVVRKNAPEGRNATAISVASSAVGENKAELHAYLKADPRAFDVLLVNRYPIYRAYGPGGAAAESMTAKLGLSTERSKQEKLADNEFANLDDYFASVTQAVNLPNLDGRDVFPSMQAYGLRDDCAGAACKATSERRPRRSPTWDELLYLFTSIWISGADGTVLYAHYFSLYDKALRGRLDNLEDLKAGVFRNLPRCAPGTGVEVRTAAKPRSAAPAGVVARFAAVGNTASRPEYLVVANGARARSSVRLGLAGIDDVAHVDQLRFDGQGKPAPPLREELKPGSASASRELALELDGFAVKVLKITYR